MCFGKILVGYWSLQFIWVDFPFQPTTLVPPPFWHLLASRGYHFRSVFFLEAKKCFSFSLLVQSMWYPLSSERKCFIKIIFLGFEAKKNSNLSTVSTFLDFLPLRLSMKSIFWILEIQKTHLEALNFYFHDFYSFWRLTFTQIKNSEALILEKRQFFNFYRLRNWFHVNSVTGKPWLFIPHCIKIKG